MTYDGKNYRKYAIKTIVEKKLPVKTLSFNEITHAKEYKDIINYFKKPLKNKKLYNIKIKTKKGFKILKGTGEHKIRTSDGMVKLKNICINDRIIIKD